MRVGYDTARRLKSSKSLLSIKEFSEMSGIEQSTLRYWDDIGLFRPAKRDEDNNYRYYSPQQIMLVNFIKVLSSLNIPLKVISSISENRSPETILKLMEQQETVLDAELSRLHEAYSTIHTLRDTIQQGMNAPDLDHISVQNLDAMPLTMGPPNRYDENKLFYPAFMGYCRHAKENRINLNNPIGGYYSSIDRYAQEPSLPSSFFTVDPHGRDRRPAGKYLVGYTQGHYGQMSDAPQRLLAFADEQGIALGGPVYVLRLFDEISVKEPSAYLAQVCAALNPAMDRNASGW